MVANNVTDLYKLLGVRKNANAATIKSAYRNKAKRVHPDAGGSEASFEELKLARDVLVDSDARAHYDSTGKIKQSDPDQGRGPILALIGAILQHVVGVAVQKGVDLKTEDVVEAVVVMLKQRQNDLTAQSKLAATRQKVLLDIVERFETKEPEGDNVMRALALGSLSTLDSELRMHEQMKAMHGAALILVQTHKFRRDLVRVPRLQQPTYQNCFFGGGATT